MRQNKTHKIKEINEFHDLVVFFMNNRLEIEPGDEEIKNFIKGWEIKDDEDSHIIAGAALAYIDDKYVLNGIAVEEGLRAEGLGRRLLAKVIKEVKSRGGSRLYLVARAPEFFRKNKFLNDTRGEAPDFDCSQCPQRGVDCFPEIMFIDVE